MFLFSDRWQTLRRDPRLVWAAAIALGVLLVALPFVTDWAVGRAWVRIAAFALLYVMLALGLNIVVGYAGLLDLGYVAFFAIGAYTMGILTTTAVGPESGQIVWGPGLNFWVALPAAVLFSLTAGVLLGIPVLRMRGDYLAIVTLGFGEIVRILALSDALKPNTGGSQGIVEPAIPTLGQLTASLSTQQLYYYLLLACVGLVIFIAIRLRDSRQGRSWTSRSKSLTATRPPKRLTTFREERMAIALSWSRPRPTRVRPEPQ